MKKLFIFILAGIILSSCSNEPKITSNYSISGNIIGDFNGNVFLYKRDAGDWVSIDSTVAQQGTFHFKGNIEYPELYYINLEGVQKNISLFADKGDIKITIDVKDVEHPEIIGSQAQKLFEEFEDQSGSFNNKLHEVWTNLKQAKKENNKDAIAKWETNYDETVEQQKYFILDYVMKNNTSVVSAYILLRNSYSYDEKDMEPVVNNFDEYVQGSKYVTLINEKINVLKKVAIGQPATDFTMNDMEGNPVMLSSLYGKYLLVDFWASWCGPCRNENPNVVLSYKTYKDSGYDILGVSFDKNKDNWLKAVKADNLTWHHVSDLKYWDNAAGKLYGINSIPSNILLDPEGIIIAKNIRGKDLQDKLLEIFSN